MSTILIEQAERRHHEDVTTVRLFVYACRTYCETDIDPAHRKLSQLQAVIRYLTGKESELECEWKSKEHKHTVHPCELYIHNDYIC